MVEHHLKILPCYFNDIVYNNKNFEIRKNDRHFQVGDMLVLNEWHHNKFTGNIITATVGYIHRGDGNYGLASGYCVLGLVDVGWKVRIVYDKKA